jgi:toxin ParE1/3/4
MARVVKRIAAKRDLSDHFVFLGENASVDVARRFLAAVDSSLQALARMPEMGPSHIFRNPRFAGVRMLPVGGFERYLIFYRPARDGIEVLRVLHGARDIESLFGGKA